MTRHNHSPHFTTSIKLPLLAPSNNAQVTKSVAAEEETDDMQGLRICAILFVAARLVTESLGQLAEAPGPAGPPNITAIFEKAGQFGTFMRLLRSTHVGDQITNQLNNSINGITIFAPNDDAFSSLPPGTINSLTDQQQVALIQFHELPYLVSLAQFQTISNPVRTQAGDVNNGRYPLNVTAIGDQVNISTGIIKTTIAHTVYSDDQLVVYEVDNVLLPIEIFGPPAPAAAPAPVKSKKKGSSIAESPLGADASAAVDLNWGTSGAILSLAGSIFLMWRL
ncbi:fasciclin-like arabinogalactan protein 11 [Zingiber officinale]|uniref:FAS1 domain-containing protein n=1 Tax=Zingiber officinale TaxID=94328 RepID=A0A8J5F9L3_ZINOF|nr:fasciclin-like arabinogalactan protein 11 [Zingiber officinale]KAG6485879.1 hypothetical protein ZIOFF_054446 [Zingiber officinale]